MVQESHKIGKILIQMRSVAHVDNWGRRPPNALASIETNHNGFTRDFHNGRRPPNALASIETSYSAAR